VIGGAWWGLVPYRDALRRQRELRDAAAAGGAGEAFCGVEHPPVVTLGRRPVVDVDTDRCARAGCEIVATERGGLATFHAPGQVVVYGILDARPTGVRRLVEALEDGVIAWLAGVGVAAGRRAGAPGVWVGDAKLCAVGLHVAHGWTMHGLALNLVNDLEGFGFIVPCGLRDARVGRLADFVGARAPTPEAAWPGLLACLRESVLDARARVR
jgi:lipoyl(octanoyl) transferase